MNGADYNVGSAWKRLALYFMYDKSKFMKMAGAVHVLESRGDKFIREVAMDIMKHGTQYGPAPYYGEVPYTGRWILKGWNAGKKLWWKR